MNLEDAINLCRRCHRLASFCFYNGNTFAAIARSLIQKPMCPKPKPQCYAV
ncbi:hypothetical protein [Prosthecobacter debontii]|nr:hypothetical protein [Prosthecobacter debontii]